MQIQQPIGHWYHQHYERDAQAVRGGDLVDACTRPLAQQRHLGGAADGAGKERSVA